MGHVNFASFWEGVLLMINKLKNNLDCVTDVITFVLVFVKVILFFVGLPPRLLEGITKKDIGKFQCLFSLFETS